MTDDVFRASLQEAVRVKQSALLGGVFDRWARATAPRGALKRMGPLGRTAYSAGTLAVPLGGAYLAGRELGFFDRPVDKIETAATENFIEHAPGVLHERNPLYGPAVDLFRR